MKICSPGGGTNLAWLKTVPDSRLQSVIIVDQARWNPIRPTHQPVDLPKITNPLASPVTEKDLCHEQASLPCYHLDDHHEARVFHLARQTSSGSFCIRTIRRGTSITRRTQSGVGTHQRITSFFTQPLNPLQTPVQFSLHDPPMQSLNWSNIFTTTIPS